MKQKVTPKFGYRISLSKIVKVYKNKIKDCRCDDLSAIKFIDEDTYLDDLKYPIVKYHSELVIEFFEKYSDRLQEPEKGWYPGYISSIPLYEKVCKTIGYDLADSAWYLLYSGLKRGNMKKINYGLSFEPDLSDDGTLLLLAIKNDYCQIALKLMRLGANPDKIGKDWENKASYTMLKVIRAHILDSM